MQHFRPRAPLPLIGWPVCESAARRNKNQGFESHRRRYEKTRFFFPGEVRCLPKTGGLRQAGGLPEVRVGSSDGGRQGQWAVAIAALASTMEMQSQFMMCQQLRPL